MTGAVAAGSNFTFGTAACVTYVSINSLGLAALVSNPACAVFLGYTTLGVGVLGGLTSRIYDAVPGSSSLAKVLVLALIAMPIFISATFLPLVPPIHKPDGATVNLIYYGLSALITMGAAVYVYRRYAGGASA